MAGGTYPCVDLALVAAHDGPDVILHHRNQGVLVTDLADPAGELGVPNEGVAADHLAVAGGPVDKVVSSIEVEVAARRLSGIELHRVLRRDLPEVGLGKVVDNAIGKSALVTSSAPVPSKQSVWSVRHHEVLDTDFLPLALKPALTVLAARSSMLASGIAAADASERAENKARALVISMAADFRPTWIVRV